MKSTAMPKFKDKVDASKRTNSFHFARNCNCHCNICVIERFNTYHLKDTDCVAEPISQYFENDDLTTSDIIIAVEHCFDCENHKSSLRHDSLKYKATAHSMLQQISSTLHGLSLNLRVGVIRSVITSENFIGAFEIVLSYRNRQGKVLTEKIHSKLKTRRWPIKEDIEDSLLSFISKARIPKLLNSYNSFTGHGYDGLSSYPIGPSQWSSTPIASLDWEYPIVLPDGLNKIIFKSPHHEGFARVLVTERQRKLQEEMESLNASQQRSVQWVFDMRQDDVMSRVLQEGCIICVKYLRSSHGGKAYRIAC